MGPPVIGGLAQPPTGLLSADLDEDGSMDLIWREGISKRKPLDGFEEVCCYQTALFFNLPRNEHINK